jgi:hypothetical protein
MCSKEHLRCVTGGCIYVTYGPGYRSAESPTTQPRTRTAASIRRSARGGRTISERFWCFSSPGLSLPPAGPAPEGTGARWRYQGGFHRQALSSTGSAPSDVRQPHRFVIERNRKPSLARGLAAEKKAWLSDLHSTATRFIVNIVSIACSRKNWSKLTNSSCPRSVDQSDPSK